MTNNTPTMKALVFSAIRELQLMDVPLPAIAQPTDALVHVRAVGVCGSDLHGYTGQSGRRTPLLIMGHEVTGEVVAVGEAVDHLPLGTQVAVQPTRFCGQCVQCQAGRRNLCLQRVVMGVHTDGAYAEYVVWPAANLYPLPAGLSPEAGALAEPLSIALHAVGQAHIRPRDTVFIAGAGSIGLLVLAMLRQAGVGTIAISDVSDARLAVAQELGADVTVNPRREAPREVVAQLTGGNGVDLAYEAVGLSATAQQTLAVTRNKGTVVWIGNNVRTIEIDMQAIVTRELSVLGSYGTDDKEFQRALDVLAGGQIPVDRLVNRRASLAEGPELFEQLLATPETIKCMIAVPQK